MVKKILKKSVLKKAKYDAEKKYVATINGLAKKVLTRKFKSV